MEIDEQKHGAVTVLKPRGPLVQEDAEQFEQMLNDRLSSSMGRALVDISAIPYADSRGLEALADISESLSESGQVLKLCGGNETLREVLDLTDLAGQFDHYEDVNTAVRSFL